jgi:hypothetical protein
MAYTLFDICEIKVASIRESKGKRNEIQGYWTTWRPYWLMQIFLELDDELVPAP